jgi:hypothetical protein
VILIIEDILCEQLVLRPCSRHVQGSQYLVCLPPYVARHADSPLYQARCHLVTCLDASIRSYGCIAMLLAASVDLDRPELFRLGLLTWNMTPPQGVTNRVQFLRWKIHAAVASVAEVAIFIAPLWLVWKLQQPKSVKIDIAIPFALRLL